MLIFTPQEQEALNDKLIQAAIDDNQELAGKYLLQGADINSKNHNGETALHYSVMNDNDKLLEFLINNNADVTSKDNLGRAPLFLAAGSGNLKICADLIAKGADVNDKDYARETALHSAVLSGKKEIVNLLLENGADINAHNNSSHNPLFLAYKLKDSIRRGDFQENYYALRAQQKKEQECAMPEPSPQEQEELNDKFIQTAFDDDQKSAKKYLLQGADINSKNHNGETALHYSVINDNDKFLEFLINNNADVTSKDNLGRAPLFLAAGSGNLKICADLIAKGADVNDKDYARETALHSAVLSGKKEIVNLLLENGADINAHNNDSHNPLFLAYNLKDSKRKGDFQENYNELRAQQRKEQGKEFSKSLIEAIEESDLNKLKEEINKDGFDINAKDYSGNNLLHLAAKNDVSSKMIKYLIDEGVKTNVVNNQGQSVISLVDKSSISYQHISNSLKNSSLEKFKNNAAQYSAPPGASSPAATPPKIQGKNVGLGI